MRQEKNRFNISRRFAQIECTQINADLLYYSAKICETYLRKSAGNILAITFIFLALNSNGQKLIRGIVVDSLSLNNLPGVTVKVKGSHRAAVSDINGIFLISVNPNDSLSFSFLGYHSKELLAQLDNDVMFVRMQEESIFLKEVIVEEYRYLDKKIFSQALSSMKAIKAKKGLHQTFDGAGNAGVGMAVNFAYFTKEQKEKRKLMSTLAELERIKVYEAIIGEPNFMYDMMKKYSLDEKRYYELLAAFNQENSSLIRSGRDLEIVYALHYHFSHPDAHITYK